MMRIVHFTSLNQLAPYADDWDRLAGGMPFRSWTWLGHWWRHYGPGEEVEDHRHQLVVLGVFDDRDSLMGIAPWYLERSAMHGRALRPLGSGEVCSDYLGVLCHPAAETVVVEALADYLVYNALDDDPGSLHWDIMALDGVDAEDREVAGLIDQLGAAGCTVHRRPGPNCWRLELPVDWESYVASLGKNLRRDLRRLERNWLDSGRAVLHSVSRFDELPEAMDILVKLHRRRRAMLGERGCFASRRFLAFYRQVVPELLRQGQLQFYWMEIDGRPAAAEFQLVGGGTLYAYQSGVEPDAMDYQPGKLINLAILRQAIEQGYRAFDFLRGDEPYKARFGAQPHPSVEYRVVPRRAVAQFRHNVWLAGSNIKQWIKS